MPSKIQEGERLAIKRNTSSDTRMKTGRFRMRKKGHNLE